MTAQQACGHRLMTQLGSRQISLWSFFRSLYCYYTAHVSIDHPVKHYDIMSYQPPPHTEAQLILVMLFGSLRQVILMKKCLSYNPFISAPVQHTFTHTRANRNIPLSPNEITLAVRNESRNSVHTSPVYDNGARYKMFMCVQMYMFICRIVMN